MALAHLPAEPPQGLDLQIEGLELVAQRMDEDPQRVAVRPQLRSQVGIQRALDGLRRDQPPADQEQRDLRFTLGQREQRPEPVAVNGGGAIRAHEPSGRILDARDFSKMIFRRQTTDRSLFFLSGPFFLF